MKLLLDETLVLGIGNAGNDAVLGLLMDNRVRIAAFDADALESLLVLRAPKR